MSAIAALTRARADIGTALINEGLAPADADGCRCDLETSSERNLPLYRRAAATSAGRLP